MDPSSGGQRHFKPCLLPSTRSLELNLSLKHDLFENPADLCVTLGGLTLYMGTYIHKHIYVYAHIHIHTQVKKFYWLLQLFPVLSKYVKIQVNCPKSLRVVRSFINSFHLFIQLTNIY